MNERQEGLCEFVVTGGFGPDPMAGLFPWNVKLLLLLDDRLGIEVHAMAQGPTARDHLHTEAWSEVEVFAERKGSGHRRGRLALGDSGAHDAAGICNRLRAYCAVSPAPTFPRMNEVSRPWR